MNICKICNQQTKNKVYCSEKCQYAGYKTPIVQREERKCVFCQELFLIRKTKKTKYCSRSCVDKHKKTTMIGNKNCSHSEEHKQATSIRMKNLWQSSEHKNKVYDGMVNAMIGRKYWFGNDPESILKKTKTLIENIYNISYEEYKTTIFVEKTRYYNEVYKETNKQPLHLLENYDKRGHLSTKDDAYHLDHIIPISYGFENSIDPKIIGDISNLQMLPAMVNITKGNKYES